MQRTTTTTPVIIIIVIIKLFIFNLVLSINSNKTENQQGQVSLNHSLIVYSPSLLKYSDYYCESNHLHLLNLYFDQTKSMSQYNNICGTKFLQLYKLANESVHDILLYASIFNQDINETDADFNLLSQLLYYDINLNYLNIRVVLRFEQIENQTLNGPLNITFNSTTYLINLKKNQTVTEYLLPSIDYYLDQNQLLSLNVTDDQRKLMSDSYMIICLDTHHKSSQCMLIIIDDHVLCKCYITSKGYIIVLVEIIFMLIILCILFIKEWCKSYTIFDPEVQCNPILCSSGEGKFEYLAIFRVGPATIGFDFQNSYIDIQLFSSNHEPVGIPYRYSCDNLPNVLLAEMHMIVSRISRMPTLIAIQMNHSSMNHLLYFHDFELYDLMSDTLIQSDQINRFITCEPATFPIRTQERLNSTSSSTMKCTQKSASNTNRSSRDSEQLKSDSWIALIDTPPPNMIEHIVLTILIIGLNCLVIVRFGIGTYYDHGKFVNQSRKPISGTFFIVTCLSLALVIPIEYLMMRYLKRYSLIERRTQMVTGESNYKFRIIRFIILLLLFIIGLAMAIYSITYGSSLSLVDCGLWSGLFLSTLALSINLWLLIDSFIYNQRFQSEEADMIIEQCSLDPKAYKFDHHSSLKIEPINSKSRQSFGSDKSLPLVNTVGDLVRMRSVSFTSYYGPRLRNPKLNKRRSQIAATGSYTRFMNERNKSSISMKRNASGSFKSKLCLSPINTELKMESTAKSISKSTRQSVKTIQSPLNLKLKKTITAGSMATNTNTTLLKQPKNGKSNKVSRNKSGKMVRSKNKEVKTKMIRTKLINQKTPPSKKSIYSNKDKI